MEKEPERYDVLVAGATPAGIMAAIAAAREGFSVALVEYHAHIGGMSASGLGKSDVENREAIRGLFIEFTQRVYEYYVSTYGADSENVRRCHKGYYYEPSVAELVFHQMIQKSGNIKLYLSHQLSNVIVEAGRVKGAVFTCRDDKTTRTVHAGISIDATYEGDLFALAGAGYRVGRESRDEYNEVHAGKIFFDYDKNVFLDGSSGDGDDGIPAYTFRLCLTDDPENAFVLADPPEAYDRKHYTKYFDDLKAGRLGAPEVFKEGHGYYPAHFNTMLRVFSFAEIPNRKYDVNTNPRPLGFPFVEKNRHYPTANWNEREKIYASHRRLAEGLLYFIQNDPEVPVAHRNMARRYHLPKDEFRDNGHFPWQLYVREARRLKGRYVLNENDLIIQKGEKRTRIFYDSIISGEFPIDSFPVTRQASFNEKVLEGYIGMLEITPYQIPYRIMLPENLGGLLIPGAASTTHVAYSAIRMEPLWMCIGQAAGIAASLAITMNVDVTEIPVQMLQKHLLDRDMTITFFTDNRPGDKAFKAVQYWGTKGFFDSYIAGVREPLTYKDLSQWLEIFSDHFRWPVSYPKSLCDGFGEMSISVFSEIIRQLVSGHVLSDSSHSGKLYSRHSGYGPENWQYERRDHTLPVLRGEACLALYNVFFGLWA